MMRFRSKAIGGIAVAVASITALAACSSSSSSTGAGNSSPGAVKVAWRDRVGAGGGHRHAEGGDHHLGHRA